MSVKNNLYALLLSFLMVPLFAISNNSESDQYQIKTFVGDEIKQYLPFIYTLCLTEYRGNPYLYEESSPGEYYDFLSWYLTSKDGALAIVFNGSEPVGFITGTSLIDFEAHFSGVTALFENAGMNAADYYYFGEVIVQKEHRGHFLSKRLFASLEEYGYSRGYTKGCFVCESHESHPSKPKDYREFAGLCLRLGYQKSPVVMQFTWNTIQPEGPSIMQEHVLNYWVKDLPAA
jgi:GNAT superfamily N-acetyltransferase